MDYYFVLGRGCVSPFLVRASSVLEALAKTGLEPYEITDDEYETDDNILDAYFEYEVHLIPTVRAKSAFSRDYSLR